ncbi:CYTH domain-containing protein [Velocimicrobium porci]|uniref:CYTH domain-containing protein n=1 Tax=Velocimicrobium porci TaxID=2606634 RepID=A0A6L5XX28_9FIRM|nr:CYTH domain-containing protein [Velocimicrobium porci]MSS63097.1 CYTH domain-containing protein [Velocimicrobium porci]
MEIEKKYTVKYLPEGYETYPSKRIEQGYLCESPVIRIRKSNDSYILTYKSKLGVKTEDEEEAEARVNQEVEVFLTEEGYTHLKKKVDGNMIEKTRYIIPLEGERKAELDVFHGALEGLCFVEVEFDSLEQAKNFIAPEWFDEDVSFDSRYLNKNLIYEDGLGLFRSEKEKE